MADPVSLKAIVHGHVQGVFYRAFVSRRSGELDIVGYVRNMPDGTVEVYAEGEKEKLETLLSHLRRGPAGARVDEVETKWAEYSGKYRGFGIGY